MKRCHAIDFYFLVLLVFISGLNNIYAQTYNLTYTGKYLSNLRIPFGGIGTGNILLGGRGQFEAIEIMNRPNREQRPSYTFFSIYIKKSTGENTAKILERELLPPYNDVSSRYLNGLPRFREVECFVPYPFVYHTFQDKEIPVEIQLESYNPLIPLDADDSGIPIVIFNWLLINPTNDTMEISISFNFRNPIENLKKVNEIYTSPKFKGIRMYSFENSNINQEGEIIVGTTETRVSLQTHWYKGTWQDHAQRFWDDFTDDGKISDVFEADTVKNTDGIASVLVSKKLDPKEQSKIPFYLSWYFPMRTYELSETFGIQEAANKQFKNYYATLYESAEDALTHFLDKESKLYSDSKTFSNLIMNSTHPGYVREAVLSQLSSIKTQLLNRMADGKTHGFEGVVHTRWCCPGTCTHVYNYEQTIAALFPSIERSMRNVEFLHNTKDNGFQSFRAVFPLGDYFFDGSAAADGQMGSIVRVYREWKYSGDIIWLKKLWTRVKSALEFAWSTDNNYQWDMNRNGLLTGWQHNTYDIDFYDINPMTSCLYLAALKAGTEMAESVEDFESADLYSEIYQRGVKNFQELMWNGEYFFQPNLKKNESDLGNLKYQFGDGCLSDQLLGQYLAEISGLGKILDSDKIRSALKAICKYNFLPEVRVQQNTQRVYASNDEAGLALCSWPRGNRPDLPFVYAYEIWTGIEYQVAATMIFNDLVAEGLEIVKAVQDRHDGYKRNPFEHNESGWHYARAMSSWALILALSGFEYDGINKSMIFEPKINQENFKTFWSAGSAWGGLEISEDAVTLSVEYGCLEFKKFGIKTIANMKSQINRKVNDWKNNEENPYLIEFEKPIILNKHEKLEFSINQK